MGGGQAIWNWAHGSTGGNKKPRIRIENDMNQEGMESKPKPEETRQYLAEEINVENAEDLEKLKLTKITITNSILVDKKSDTPWSRQEP